MHTDYATPKCCPHLTTALGRTFAFGSEGGKVRCPVPPCRLSASRQGTDVYPGNAAGPLWERSEGGETPAFLRLGTQGTHLGPTPLYIGSSVSGELILGIAAFPAFPTLIYQRVRGAPMRSLSVPVRSQLARANLRRSQLARPHLRQRPPRTMVWPPSSPPSAPSTAALRTREIRDSREYTGPPAARRREDFQ